MKRREKSKKKIKGIWRAPACTKTLKRRALAQKGRQWNEKFKEEKFRKKRRTLAIPEQQSCRKTKINASAMQLKEELRIMKTKWGCGNGVKNIRICVYTAALIDEMKDKSRKAGIGWEPRVFLTRYTDVSGLDRLELDWKWPRKAKGARTKRCEKELLSSDWSKFGLFGKRNSIPTTLMLNTSPGSK
ncbi:hypothetical protein PIB30_067915 [Stylosanthes scabra]|uniref:Uncharacterized protein n=1 Tax=Stylosanthes scabra TaxID=79078 RepID=A0ABU6QM95_9FABA|nr:hypothetical protein [Stylosanthes scabra]